MTFIKGLVPWNKGTKGIMKVNAGSFKKGLVPWNKGTKGIMKSNAGTFKKGRISLTKEKIGTIKQRIDKKKKIRNWIKIKYPNKWMLYSRYLWEKTYGPIPKGYIIHHKDKDSMNDLIENYEIMDRAQHMGIHRKELQTKDLNTSFNILNH